jgi:hypothetical protein
MKKNPWFIVVTVISVCAFAISLIAVFNKPCFRENEKGGKQEIKTDYSAQIEDLYNKLAETAMVDLPIKIDWAENSETGISQVQSDFGVIDFPAYWGKPSVSMKGFARDIWFGRQYRICFMENDNICLEYYYHNPEANVVFPFDKIKGNRILNEVGALTAGVTAEKACLEYKRLNDFDTTKTCQRISENIYSLDQMDAFVASQDYLWFVDVPQNNDSSWSEYFGGFVVHSWQASGVDVKQKQEIENMINGILNNQNAINQNKKGFYDLSKVHVLE